MSNLFDSIKIYEESFVNPEDINHEDNNFDEEMKLNLILKDLAKDYHIQNIYKQSEILFCFYKSTIHLKSFYEECLNNQYIQSLIYEGKLVFPPLESIDTPKFNILFLSDNLPQIKMSISVPEILDKIEYQCFIMDLTIDTNILSYIDNLEVPSRDCPGCGTVKVCSRRKTLLLTFFNHTGIIEEILRVYTILYNTNIISTDPRID